MMTEPTFTVRVIRQHQGMKLTHGKANNNPEVKRVVCLASKEIRENGWDGGMGNLNLDFRHKFFAIQDGEKIVSVLVYMPHVGDIWVNIAWTDPAYRQRGYYMLLWYELVRKIKRTKYQTIWGAFHAKNTVSRAMQEKQGRAVSSKMSLGGFFITYYDLKPLAKNS